MNYFSSLRSVSSQTLPEGSAILAGTSNSSLWDMGGSDNNVQPYVNWYQTKNGARVAATWYSLIDYDYSNIYLIYGYYNDIHFDVSEWSCYCGTWTNGFSYGGDSVVEYDGTYYISKVNENIDAPTSSSWEEISMPYIGNVSASVYNPAFIPKNFDYLIPLKSLRQGDVYVEDVSEDKLGMCVVLSAGITYKSVVTQNGSSTVYYISEFMTQCQSEPIDFNRLYHDFKLNYNNKENRLNITADSANSDVKYFMEFYEEDYNPTNTGKQSLEEFFLTSIVDLEGSGYSSYYDLSEKTLHKWRAGEYTVGIEYKSSKNRSRIYSAINNAIYELNQKMKKFGIVFNKVATNSYEDTTGDITFTVGAHQELFGYEATLSDWYNGTWKTDKDEDGYICRAEILLCNDVCWHETFDAVAMEELLQCMGAGYDQTEYIKDTIHSDFVYLNKPSYINNIDAGILDILYSDYIHTGMDAKETALAVNPPNGATIISTNQSLSLLKNGSTYNIKVYAVNKRDEISSPKEIVITIPGTQSRPDNWYWTTDVENLDNIKVNEANNTASLITAIEWNSLCSRVNEFRKYRGLSSYTFTKVYAGDEFTADIYNQAVHAINEIEDNNKGQITEAVASKTNATNAERYFTLNGNLNLIE